MKVKIAPSLAKGVVKAPPSKSMAHRLLICAGLCAGEESLIRGIELSQDVAATIDCLRSMGAVCNIDGDRVSVRGIDARHAVPEATLFCRESGSTLRFFIPIALMCGETVTFCGSEKLMSRPLGVYEELCQKRGLFFEKGAELKVRGCLEGGVFELPGDISSQFVSGLLFALPLAGKDSLIKLIPPVESRSYIDLTLSALRDFGVEARWIDECSIVVPGEQSYRGRNISVEGDHSNAAFLSALNMLGGQVELQGLRQDSLQGDRVYSGHFQAIKEGYAKVSLADCPDLGPILFAMAAAFHGGKFTNTRRLRIKESDRAQAMARELKKFGAELIVDEDEVSVLPGKLAAPNSELYGHNDHRIVMSMAVLLTKFGGTIDDAQAVSKSYPGFFETLKNLGIDVEIIDE